MDGSKATGTPTKSQFFGVSGISIIGLLFVTNYARSLNVPGVTAGVESLYQGTLMLPPTAPMNPEPVLNANVLHLGIGLLTLGILGFIALVGQSMSS